MTAKGLNGEKMKVRLRDIKKGSVAKSVRAPYTRECQEVLIKASTHGLRFLETGGGTLSHDHSFIAAHLHKKEQTLKDKAVQMTADETEQ